MADPVFEGFSLWDEQGVDGGTTVAAAVSTQDLDVYGVEQASLDPDSDSFENTGDDVVLSEWNWLNKAGIEVRSGYVSFPLIATLTGRAITSSGSGDSQLFSMDLWHEDDFNVAPKPMLVRMPSKDKSGAVRILDIGLYKVSFKPMTFDGPAYKDGLKISYAGTALMSDEDELGVAHVDGKKRVGKLISKGA